MSVKKTKPRKKAPKVVTSGLKTSTLTGKKVLGSVAKADAQFVANRISARVSKPATLLNRRSAAQTKAIFAKMKKG